MPEYRLADPRSILDRHRTRASNTAAGRRHHRPRARRTALARVRAQEPALNAYITLTDDEALAQADAADARLRAGDAAPLTGIPIGVKDLLSTRGVPTTAASRMLDGFTPIVDSTVVAKLREAGAVFVGKTNLDEFAMGSSTEHSAFGQTHNPWDLERVPGGSSGGSAATVAAGGVPLSLGTDTGGSIRQPAALCGILGLKPTYGRVSRFGVIAFASSLEQVGPFGRDAEDVALLLQAIAGQDVLDATTAPVAVPDYTAELARGLDGLRVGVPREFDIEGMEDGVREAVEQAIAVFAANGAIIDRDVSLPSVAAALPVYYIIAPSEASANLARYDGVKYGYSYHDAATMWEEMEQTAWPWIRRRGQTSHHARHLRTLRRLLRRLLPQGAEGAHAHPSRVRRGSDRPRPPPHPDDPHRRLPPRREDGRPARDVPQRPLHAVR